MEPINYKGYTIKLVSDEDPQNPREWDNLGTMYAKGHRRYQLGDDDCDGMTTDMFNSWKETREYIEKKLDAAVILTLRLYDHSGISMYIPGDGGYRQHESWDSGQVGFIYISREKIRKGYNIKRISPNLLKRVEGYLRGEVETYNHYLTGNCWGYQIIDSEGEELDACFGYYGNPEEKDGCLDEAKEYIDRIVEPKILV